MLYIDFFFFFPVATVGKDWPNKLQPGPAMYIPLTRCAQLDACSNSVKGQPKLILPVKPGSSGDMSLGFSRGLPGPSLLTER